MSGKVRVIRSQIDATTYDNASDEVISWASEKRPHHVIAANVHVVMSGFWRKSYQAIVDAADLVTPDGVPLVWAMRAMGQRKQQRVYGPDLMLAVCARAEKDAVPVYLYGGTGSMLDGLERELRTRFPALSVAGAKAPPFRELTDDELDFDAKEITASGARILFVGLGCPKQDLWITRQKERLPLVMLGVGAAFQFISGDTSQAPRWMMNAGLEWLFRLCTETSRVWRRHIVNDPVFVVLIIGQILNYLLTPEHRSDDADAS